MRPLNQQASRQARRSRLALAAIALTLASAAAPAAAATFQYRHYVTGMTFSPTSAVQQVAAEIMVALTGGPSLPAGEVSTPYRYDLKQLLAVTGEPGYSSANVSWTLQGGSLPIGLSLGSDGVVSGTPTTKNLAGNSFQVKASYKGKDGQQEYTIVVNGAVLRVTQISSGGRHTCALTTAGGVKCWGNNTYGQLGDSSTTDRWTPVEVAGLSSGVASVTAGSYHTCAVTSTGGAKCWGANGKGQVGAAGATSYSSPVDVSGMTTDTASIFAGDTHTCALTTSGGAKCWGNNQIGELGNGTTTSSSFPVNVTGLSSGVSHITVGNLHTCAVTSTGGVKCWGYNGSGQLGTNDTDYRTTPTNVLGLTSGVAAVGTGYGYSCALTTAGGVKCWGMGASGRLGNGDTTGNRLTPTNVGLAAVATSLSVGFTHVCVATADGNAKCWGSNTAGQIGDNTLLDRNWPVSVSGLSAGVVSIMAGGTHTCARTADGFTKCWGYNAYGQLGNNTTVNSSVPVDVMP